MEVSSPQLAVAVAAARVALAEALVLKVGQLLQALVVGKGSDGLTTLRIGDQVLKAALPEGYSAGMTLQLQVKTVGAAPQLAIVTPSTPQAPAAAALVRPAIPPAVSVVAPSPVPSVPAANVEPGQQLAPATSQSESGPMSTGPTTLGAKAEPVAEPPAVAETATPTIAPRPTREERLAASGSSGVRPVPATAAPQQPPGEPQSVAPATVSLQAAATRPAPSPNPAGSVVAAAEPPVAPNLAVSPAPVVLRPAPAVIASGYDAAPPVPVPVSPSAAAPGSSAQAEVPDGPDDPPTTSPLLVAQAAPRPQATMTDLPRRVVAAPMPQLPTAPAPMPQTPQGALAQMLPEAMSKQDSVGPLLISLMALVQRPAALPEPIIRAALGVLAQRIIATDGKVIATDLERAVVQSGIWLEAWLAKAGLQPGDAKAGLLALREGLAKLLGEAPAPVAGREVAPPPLKGLPLRAPAANAAPLPDAPRDLARALHGQADAAVSRIKLMQLASLPDADPGRPAAPSLRMELPFLIGHELVMAQIQISRDGARRDIERRRGWTMRLALNFSATGEVGAEVGLLGKAVNVALWAAEPETAIALNAALPELNGALAAIGLKPGSLRIRQGVPGPDKPASGRLLDSVS